MAFGAGLTRGAQLLTHRTIETLRPTEAPYRVTDQRCKGLAVRVASSGVKTWDLAYRIRGTAKMRRLSLGRTTDVSLEQARERANELTSAARSGRDLVAEEEDARGAAASRVTVEKLIDLYLRRRVVGRLLNALGDLGHCEVLVAIVDRLELAPVDRNDSPREKVELTAQHDELRARRADRRPAVAAEVGDRLEVRHQSAGQPHQLDVALGLPFEPPARLDAIEIAVEVDLQKRRRMIG